MIELQRIKGVGPNTAEKLTQTGIETVSQLAQVTESGARTIADETGLTMSKVGQLIRAAKEIAEEMGEETSAEDGIGQQYPVEKEGEESRGTEVAQLEEESEFKENSERIGSYSTVAEILHIHTEEPRLLSFKERLIAAAIERPDIRERIVKNIVKELT